MSKKSTTLPVEDGGKKFDAKVSYEITAGKKITITAVEDDEGHLFDLNLAEKLALARKLAELHPDHTLPEDLPDPDHELPPPQPDNTLPDFGGPGVDNTLPPVQPEIDQSLPPVHPGEPTQPLPIDPITAVPLPIDPGSPQPLPFPPGTPTDPVTGEPLPVPEAGQQPAEPSEDVARRNICPACGQRLPLTIAEQRGGQIG